MGPHRDPQSDRALHLGVFLSTKLELYGGCLGICISNKHPRREARQALV